MTFYDKNGTEIEIGDHIVPDDGMELLIVSSGKIADYAEEVMFGQQLENLCAFSVLTQKNLSAQWTKVEVSDE
ncbi:MAG: hypothetical protein LUF80_00645 [Oscillospiraceae bacterium]|nr:hypothetical protein [Oscillospiraceae bacterium]